MKSNKMKVIIGLIIVILISGIISILYINKDSSTKDEKKFKKEYESINQKSKISLTIPEDNKIKYINSKETIDILKNKTGVIYFGFPDCPWCRNIVPILINTAKCECLEQIYYFNALSIRDIKHLDESGNIVIDKQGSKDYYEIVELLSNYLGSYEGLNDDSIKRLYFPTVVFVKNGRIVDIHISTVEDQTDPYIPLTKKQQKKLQQEYKEGINKMESNVCDFNNKTSC